MAEPPSGTVTELPSGTVTFLFTDIEGSTRLLKQLGDRYREVLAEHRRILREAAEARQGREVDTQGDSFFFAFSRANAALAAAVLAQRALAEHEWPDGANVRVRMGLHTAEPEVGEERYVGLGVHRAARIGAAAHGGQVLLSSATRELVEERVGDAVVRQLGVYRLKDFDKPERLYQLDIEGLPLRFPPVRAEPAQSRRRRMLSVATALLAVGIAAVVALALVFLLGRSGGGAGLTVPPNALGVIDPKTNRVIAQIGVGIRPGPVAVGGASVWVGNEVDRSLSQVDAGTHKVEQAIPLAASPTGVAHGEGAVWVAEGPAGALERIDPLLRRATKRFSGLAGAVRVSGSPAGSVAVGGGAVWAAYGSSAVIRVDPKKERIAGVGFAGLSPSAIAYGGGVVWVANEGGDTVSRFSTTTNQTVDTINVGRAPRGVVFGDGLVWVTDSADDAVSRVDPSTRSSSTIHVGRVPVGIAYANGAVWVANSKDGTVSRIDAATGRVVKTITLGGSPVGIATGDGLVWVTVQSP